MKFIFPILLLMLFSTASKAQDQHATPIKKFIKAEAKMQKGMFNVYVQDDK